ncbi:hypothetical protein EXIGUO9Y_50015 [Exiguobacterium oxidotolerans]|uniref:Uncharacterized protein n=1 Tax=Exiguobacterium oxidotolerans TaxID=223958 RepID=A0A653IH22_9BACL|nr:hypothetical protein EXIGUO9Y_50015 [Exiguobacterium oxidotolerans]
MYDLGTLKCKTGGVEMDKTDGWIIVSIMVGLYFGLFAKPKRVTGKTSK